MHQKYSCPQEKLIIQTLVQKCHRSL